ncbi:MAG: TIGR03960 family B12-binding radical SAM protein [Myxococcota bacterium]
MNLSTILERELLPLVEKPSRYLGTEINSVRKPDARVRLVLAFPDLYDLGLGNLGLHILYAVLNQIDGVSAERAYAPGVDMEALLRERNLPLFALESKDSIDQFDGIGFTLQSELTFTNILNMIELSGMPLRTKDRREEDPLTFAGGPAVFNPEPLVPFIDFFVIGDGEDVVIEIAKTFDEVSGREARLSALAEIEGVYVPARFEMETLPDGRVLPFVDGPKIRKRITRDLNGATFPVDYIVPFTQQVHDRISLEVLRGCTQGCRFCQAGMTTRPVRERTLDNINDLMERTLETTGYEEVSLVSLSTCDYSNVRQMVDSVVRKAAPQRVGVSLPSLRLDSFSVELADMVAGIRRTGLTFAPEAASPRLRAVINKWIPDEDLLNMSSEAFKRGWDHVKLYFMIGLPTERDDDIEAIADLTLKTVAVGKEWNPKAKVNTGVSTFVPKPFTPFQWAEQLSLDETHRRQRILLERFRKTNNVKFGRHDPCETWLEGLVSRSDRRAGDLLEAAFKLGCRFDAWDEHRNLALWQQAIEESGFDVDDALRARDMDERLPWDHIDILVSKEWFKEDWERAVKLQHAEDCRHSKCHRCGVIDEERPLCAHMLRNSIEGRKTEKTWVRPPPPIEMGSKPAQPGLPPVRAPEPPPLQRLVFRVGIVGEARYLSHLETMNAWIRSLRRAKVPLVYSQGFHPHPKVAFSSARPVAEASLGEYMDITINQRMDPQQLLKTLSEVVPDGFRVFGVTEVGFKAPSLMSAVSGMDYVAILSGLPEQWEPAVAGLLVRDTIEVERRNKKKKRRRFPGMRIVDIRPNIRDVTVESAGQDQTVLRITLDTVDGRGAKVREVMQELNVDVSGARLVRVNTRFVEELDLGAMAQGAGERMNEALDARLPEDNLNTPDTLDSWAGGSRF